MPLVCHDGKKTNYSKCIFRFFKILNCHFKLKTNLQGSAQAFKYPKKKSVSEELNPCASIALPGRELEQATGHQVSSGQDCKNQKILGQRASPSGSAMYQLYNLR